MDRARGISWGMALAAAALAIRWICGALLAPPRAAILGVRVAPGRGLEGSLQWRGAGERGQ